MYIDSRQARYYKGSPRKPVTPSCDMDTSQELTLVELRELEGPRCMWIRCMHMRLRLHLDRRLRHVLVGVAGHSLCMGQMLVPVGVLHWLHVHRHILHLQMGMVVLNLWLRLWLWMLPAVHFLRRVCITIHICRRDVPAIPLRILCLNGRRELRGGGWSLRRHV